MDEDDEKAAVIVVTSTGREMESPMDPRFGRCAYFAVIRPSGEMESVENSACSLGNGAGIQAAKLVADMNVEAVVTGNVGPNAFRVLEASGIRVFVGGSGTVREATESYRKETLREASSPTAPGRHRVRGGQRGKW
jgi:predicted Fe-Mo cluster-binding NifX family protein